MKKSNMLIVVFVIIAAASAAMAEDVGMDFDGRFEPQTMHGIFANSHQFVPPATPTPAKTGIDLMGSACALVCVGQKTTDDCRCEPFIPGPGDYDSSSLPYTWWPYMTGEASLLKAAANAPSRKSPPPVKSYDQAAARELSRYYMAQEKIKGVVAEYYTANGNNKAAASLADKGVRVSAGNGVVFVIRSGSQEQISDHNLAEKVEAMVHPNGKEKLLPIIAGATFVATCMSNDNCWNAVGDGVSSASAAASEIYYSWINPGPAPEVTWP